VAERGRRAVAQPPYHPGMPAPPAAVPRPLPSPSDDAERLAKRLARDLGCSRSEAERWIEAGFVSVDGVVVDTPPSRVRPSQRVELARDATAEAVVPVTLLLHKQPGLDAVDGPYPADGLLTPANRWAEDSSGIRTVSAHLRRQPCLTPLETEAGGLIVFSQDPRITRRLVEDLAQIEHETMVDVSGPVDAQVIAQLCRADPVDGRPVPEAKVSVGSGSGDSVRLRFAIKGHQPGRIERACEAAGLEVSAVRRTRIGRVPLAALPVGQWRYLATGERF